MLLIIRGESGKFLYGKPQKKKKKGGVLKFSYWREKKRSYPRQKMGPKLNRGGCHPSRKKTRSLRVPDGNQEGGRGGSSRLSQFCERV